MSSVEIIPFTPVYMADYVLLNRQWIEKYFRIEPMDIAQLERPTKNILDLGGEIFFLLEDGKVVGTCAMVPEENGFELAKMAVAEGHRRKGYGDLLLKHSIDWARERNAKTITILSNTVLKAAIALYKKHGFQTIRLGQHPHYERCNIEMELSL